MPYRLDTGVGVNSLAMLQRAQMLTYAQSAALAQTVYETAGIPAGITPGVAAGVTPGTVTATATLESTYGLWVLTNSSNYPDPRSNRMTDSYSVQIYNEGDAQYFSAATNYASPGTYVGTGTLLDPYVIQRCKSWNEHFSPDTGDHPDTGAAVNYHIIFDDPAADYYVKFEDVWFYGKTGDNSLMYFDVPSDHYTEFLSCRLERPDTPLINGDLGGMMTLTNTFGRVLFDQCLMGYMRNANIIVTGNAATDLIEFRDSKWDYTGLILFCKYPTLTAGDDVAVRRWNLKITRCEWDGDASVYFNFMPVSSDVFGDSDFTLEMDSCRFGTYDNSNPIDNAGAGLQRGCAWLLTGGSNSEFVKTLPKTITRNAFYCGSQHLIKCDDGGSYHNVTMEYNYIYHGHHAGAAVHTIVTGPLSGDTSLTNTTKGWRLRWNRFWKFDTGTDAGRGGGSEVVRLESAEDLIAEYNWCDSAGEEFIEPNLMVGPIIVRYCGGGAGYAVDTDRGGFNYGGIVGQMIEPWQANPSGPSLATGFQVHDIWGKCGTNGLIMSSGIGAKAWNIAVDCSDGINPTIVTAPTQREPVANIEIRDDAINCTMKGFISHVDYAPGPPDNWPLVSPKLAYDDGGTTPGTNINTAEAVNAIVPFLSSTELVAVTADDGSDDGTTYLDNVLWVGQSGGGNPYITGIRFIDAPWTSRCIILKAELTLGNTQNFGSGAGTLTVSCDDVADASAFGATPNLPSEQTSTAATKTAATPTPGFDVVVDVKDLIQEVVDNGYVQDNAISFKITSAAAIGDYTAYRDSGGAASGSESVPSLYVEWAYGPLEY